MSHGHENSQQTTIAIPQISVCLLEGPMRQTFRHADPQRIDLRMYPSEALDQISAAALVESKRLKARRWLLLRTLRNVEPRSEARVL
jgi:hypothetical protein